MQDYMEDNHGKEIKLVRTTVKVPGQRPRGSESTSSANQTAGNQRANGHANKLLDSSKQFPVLLLVCVSFTIIGQPRNSVLIHRV